MKHRWKPSASEDQRIKHAEINLDRATNGSLVCVRVEELHFLIYLSGKQTQLQKTRIKAKALTMNND